MKQSISKPAAPKPLPEEIFILRKSPDDDGGFLSVAESIQEHVDLAEAGELPARIGRYVLAEVLAVSLELIVKPIPA